MAMVRVWNDHTKEHVEMFKGDLIKVQAQNFIEMDRLDAIQFVGQFTGIVRDALGNDLRPKKLRLDDSVIPKTPEKIVQFKCMHDNKEFSSQKELDMHVLETHVDSLHKDPEIDKFINKNRS